jgi:hypothetical protein
MLSVNLSATKLHLSYKSHYRTVDQLRQKPKQDVNGTKPVAKLKPQMSDLWAFQASIR